MSQQQLIRLKGVSFMQHSCLLVRCQLMSSQKWACQILDRLDILSGHLNYFSDKRSSKQKSDLMGELDLNCVNPAV